MHPKGVWISGRYNVSMTAMRTRVITVATLGLVSLGMAQDKPLTRAQVDFFEAKIRPVLATHCFECHGNKDKGGLKLNSREAALKGGDSGAVIVLGKPKQSLLIKAVEHLDEDLAMPPK